MELYYLTVFIDERFFKVPLRAFPACLSTSFHFSIPSWNGWVQTTCLAANYLRFFIFFINSATPPPPPWHAHKYTHPYNVWMHLHNNEFSLYHVCNHLDSGRPNSCLIAHGLQSSRGCCLVLTAPEKQREGTREQESTPEERRRKNLKTHQDSPLILEHESRVQWEGWRQGKGKSELTEDCCDPPWEWRRGGRRLSFIWSEGPITAPETSASAARCNLAGQHSIIFNAARCP